MIDAARPKNNEGFAKYRRDPNLVSGFGSNKLSEIKELIINNYSEPQKELNTDPVIDEFASDMVELKIDWPLGVFSA